MPTGAERSGAPNFLCELERSEAELQNFCTNCSGAERSSKIYVSSGAERSGAETKLTSLHDCKGVSSVKVNPAD